MSDRSDRILVWAPRVLGIAVCLFLSIFALDAFGPDKTALEGVRDFVIHVSPMLALLAVVALSWRWEWVGGSVFTLLAVVYAVWAHEHPSWIAFIGGPLLVVGALFWLSWGRHRRLHGAT